MHTRYPFISYLKALCIILVIICHCNFTDQERLNFTFPYIINTAVPFFMLITAFNYSNSYLKNNISNMQQMYNPTLIFNRLKRLAIPYFIIVLIQWFFIAPHTHYTHSFTTLFVNGGMGPGSYYFPVMVQLIVLFPIIYKLVKKYQIKGLLFVFIINLIFEFICSYTNMSNSTYRLLFFRYLMYIGLGVYAFEHKDNIKDSTLSKSLIVGITYLALSAYCAPEITYPFMHWKTTSMMVAFYVFPLFIWFYRELGVKEISNTLLSKTLVLTGNASWHIFLVQATYFTILEKILNESGRMLPVNITINVLICVSIGIALFLSEKFITNLIKRNSH